mmetsp:Transcript_85591/g.228203  ORF Transcript_85591/g.228203 Transcript_85591/m.228203 type:complete len:242 (-) Transcript_85591:105-830(-)
MHKFINHLIILRASETRLTSSEIIGVLNEVLVIGADIQGHRQHTVWGNASASSVKCKFSDGNAHAIDAKIAKTQDAGAIGHDDHMNIVVGPVVNDGRHLSTVFAAEVHAPRTTKLMSEFLTNSANCWCVDEWRHFFDVIYENIEIQSLIATLKILQIHVLGFVVWLCLQLTHNTGPLLFNSFNCGWEKAANPQAIALEVVKSSALVEQRLVKHIHAKLARPERPREDFDRRCARCRVRHPP